MNQIEHSRINMNLSYQNLENLKENSFNYSRSFFHGTIISSCTYSNIIFNSSDFEGTRILDSSFQHSTFERTSINSIVCSKTNFEDINFDSAVIKDCTFINCTFINCSFENTIITNCTFELCVLEDSYVVHGESTNINYRKCKFKNHLFRNTFYYIFFEDCIFYDSTFEAYLLGYTNGLTKENVDSINFLLMGKSAEEYSFEEIIHIIEEIYLERNLLIVFSILQINKNEILSGNDIDVYYKSIIFSTNCISKMIERKTIIKSDEIIYLGRLIDYSYNNMKITPYVLNTLYNEISLVLNNTVDKFMHNKVIDELNILNNRLFFSLKSFIDTLSSKIINNNSTNLTSLQIGYHVKPAIRISEILEDFYIEQKMEGLMPKVVKEETGSFYEWITCSENLLPFLQTILAFLGVSISAIQLHKERKKNKELHKKLDMQSKRQVFNLTNITYNNNEIVNSVISPTIKLINSKKYINKNNFNGINKDNIININFDQNFPR